MPKPNMNVKFHVFIRAIVSSEKIICRIPAENSPLERFSIKLTFLESITFILNFKCSQSFISHRVSTIAK